MYALLDTAGFEVLERKPMFYLMGYPIDMKSDLFGKVWNLLMYPVRKSEIMGMIYASVLYFPELFLISFFKESPTTELLICRRKHR